MSISKPRGGTKLIIKSNNINKSKKYIKIEKKSNFSLKFFIELRLAPLIKFKEVIIILFTSFIKITKRKSKVKTRVCLYNKPIIPKKKVIYAKTTIPRGKEKMKLSRNEENFAFNNFNIFLPSIYVINTTKIK